MTFAVFGELTEASDGTVPLYELERVGITEQEIDAAMTAGEQWSNDGTDVPDPAAETLSTSEVVDEEAAAATSYYRLRATWRDRFRSPMAARTGSYNSGTGNGWGYAKYAGKHNLTTRAVQAATAHTADKRSAGGTSYNYYERATRSTAPDGCGGASAGLSTGWS